jgi:hypothetical protein
MVPSGKRFRVKWTRDSWKSEQWVNSLFTRFVASQHSVGCTLRICWQWDFSIWSLEYYEYSKGFVESQNNICPCRALPPYTTQLKNKFALLFAFLQFVNLFNCWKSAVISCQGFCCFPNTFYACQPTTRLIDTCGCYTWIWLAGGNVTFEIFQSGVLS